MQTTTTTNTLHRRLPAILAAGAAILAAGAAILAITTSTASASTHQAAPVLITASMIDPGADAIRDPSAEPATGDSLVGDWDGATVHLDQYHRRYTTGEVSFIGERVITPGDDAERTLNVTSQASGPGILTVSVTATEYMPSGARNPRLAEDVHLAWTIDASSGSTPFAQLLAANGSSSMWRGASVEVARVPIEPGATVPVTIGIQMPAEVEQHRRLGTESTELQFAVTVRLDRDTSPTTAPASEPAPDPVRHGTVGTHPKTGPGIGLAVAVVVLLAAATALDANRRRTSQRAA